MSKCLFYTTRAIDGREGPNICRHFTILKHHHDHIDFLTSQKSPASKKLIEQLSKIRVNNMNDSYRSFYQAVVRKMPTVNPGATWMDVYNEIDPVFLKEYDALYIIGGLDFHNSNVGRGLNRQGVFPHDKGQINFESLGNHLTNILAMLKAHREYGIPLHEMAFDPNEMSCDLFHSDVAVGSNYYLYHGYDIPLYNASRLDSLQYHLETNQINPLFEEENDKIYDFTFGYTILKNSGRAHYPAYIDTIAAQFDRSNVYCKNEEVDPVINTHIPGNEYLEKIKRSRFTFMLPSYNAHCFSNYRFVESIYNDCLPLIHPNCNLTDISQSFNIDLTPLVVTTAPSESDRLALLETYKNAMKFSVSYK
jgi:hypothetical protein